MLHQTITAECTPYFIDWLNISQTSLDRTVPVVAKSLKTETLLDTGETFNFHTAAPQQGSFSSNVILASNGNRYYIWGNPSRFNRVDNLFGHSTIDSAVSVYNRLLDRYNIPHFHAPTYNLLKHDTQKNKFYNVTDGAKISQIHLTRNIAVGQGNEQTFIKALSQFNYRNKFGLLTPDGNTCTWGKKSSRKHIKVYCKYAEMLKRKRKMKDALDDVSYQYFLRVLEYVRVNGVVRLEYELSSEYLKDRNFHMLGTFSDDDLTSTLFDVEQFIKRLGVSVEQNYNIADTLLKQGVVSSRQAANATQVYFLSWLQGHNVKNMCSTSQFYVHRSRLLALGYDIARPSDLTLLPIRMKDIEYITPSDLLIPEWYRQA